MMQRLGEAHKAVSGKEPIYSPVTCTTDVRFFELYYGIPATCYGPEATNIHGYEYTSLNHTHTHTYTGPVTFPLTSLSCPLRATHTHTHTQY
jgi:acetylornithine deacetylase/succinyl-diaminopimelate desuccinylase-like protein